MVPAGASIVNAGQPTTCSRNSKVAYPPRRLRRGLQPPASFSRGLRGRLAPDVKALRHAEIEPVVGIAPPLHQARSASRIGATQSSRVAGICRSRQRTHLGIHAIHRVVRTTAPGARTPRAGPPGNRAPAPPPTHAVRLKVRKVPAVGCRRAIRNSSCSARRNQRLACPGRCARSTIASQSGPDATDCLLPSGISSDAGTAAPACLPRPGALSACP